MVTLTAAIQILSITSGIQRFWHVSYLVCQLGRVCQPVGLETNALYPGIVLSVNRPAIPSWSVFVERFVTAPGFLLKFNRCNSKLWRANSLPSSMPLPTTNSSGERDAADFSTGRLSIQNCRVAVRRPFSFSGTEKLGLFTYSGFTRALSAGFERY